MKICFLQVGSTQENYIQKGIEEYQKRLKKYIPFEMLVVPEAKNKKKKVIEQKKEEAKNIIKAIKPGDLVILLDEKGKQFSSPKFAQFLQKKMNQSPKRIVFILGGAYGFDQEIYNLYKEKVALSELTFTHQMVRLFFVEQIYRAFTILNNQPYHH
ncbi:MAG: 23S rRNA (pseudouridine(1915)-N(3))-methyltransferase RlmH [Flavobacteriales bacterium]|jgi:23S rRNA (pseudouridine1915-N3)-methyltransferase|nr:23S rRNA (pseudouridine(1915)-N(3))-methyltransferase RlmH [Flavobacteriales bacterium]